MCCEPFFSNPGTKEMAKFKLVSINWQSPDTDIAWITLAWERFWGWGEPSFVTYRGMRLGWYDMDRSRLVSTDLGALLYVIWLEGNSTRRHG